MDGICSPETEASQSRGVGLCNHGGRWIPALCWFPPMALCLCYGVWVGDCDVCQEKFLRNSAISNCLSLKLQVPFKLLPPINILQGLFAMLAGTWLPLTLRTLPEPCLLVFKFLGFKSYLLYKTHEVWPLSFWKPNAMEISLRLIGSLMC